MSSSDGPPPPDLAAPEDNPPPPDLPPSDNPPAPDVCDKRTPRERLVAMATAAAKQPEPQRCWVVKGLLRDRIRVAKGRIEPQTRPLATRAEILRAAYGDPARHWLAWLDESNPDGTFYNIAALLAAHLAINEAHYRQLRALTEASLERHNAGSTWATLEAMAIHPTAQRLIPKTLRRVIAAQAPAPAIVPTFGDVSSQQPFDPKQTRKAAIPGRKCRRQKSGNG